MATGGFNFNLNSIYCYVYIKQNTMRRRWKRVFWSSLGSSFDERWQINHLKNRKRRVTHVVKGANITIEETYTTPPVVLPTSLSSTILVYNNKYPFFRVSPFIKTPRAILPIGRSIWKGVERGDIKEAIFWCGGTERNGGWSCFDNRKKKNRKCRVSCHSVINH